MICTNSKCYGPARNGSLLCNQCQVLRDSVFIMALCLGGSALIVAVAMVI